MVLRAPRLLTQQPRTLQENLRGLATELGIAREAAAVLVTEQPGLLIVPPSLLRTRIQVR